MRLSAVKKFVEDLIAAGGGGGGLVIGPWEDVDATGFLGGSTDQLLIAASPVPYEIEVGVTPNPNTSGGIVIASDDDSQTFLIHIASYGDPAPNVFERCLIPANIPIRIAPGFGNTSDWASPTIRRRTLG